ncbi:hypothetical protein, partial [Marinobacter alexandrii]|uniref:hypothetical protein n=1 Tax=Marinobacter alexandrii TaxID=2570351 RepID=UPI003297D651
TGLVFLIILIFRFCHSNSSRVRRQNARLATKFIPAGVHRQAVPGFLIWKPMAGGGLLCPTP